MGFGIYTSYSWPVLSMTIPMELITLGMTLCLVLESCVEFVLPLIVGYLDTPRDNDAYLKSTWIVFVLGVVGFVASIVVFFMDMNTGKVLHNPPEQQDAQDKAEAKEAEEKAEQEENKGLKDEESTLQEVAADQKSAKPDSKSGLAPENPPVANEETPAK